MSPETQDTPLKDPAGVREITVTIPADRVDSFERLVQRFLSAGDRGRCRGGKRRGPRGGRHVHVHLHG